MQRTAFFLITALVALSLIGCKKGAGSEPAKNPFIGKWTVSYELTMEESKKSPKYQPGLSESMGKTIKKMVERMKIEITAEEVIYSMNDNEQAAPYTITSTGTDGKSLIATSQAGDKEVQITFTLINDKYMNFKSTGTDDMDYYIWQPAE